MPNKVTFDTFMFAMETNEYLMIDNCAYFYFRLPEVIKDTRALLFSEVAVTPISGHNFTDDSSNAVGSRVMKTVHAESHVKLATRVREPIEVSAPLGRPSSPCGFNQRNSFCVSEPARFSEAATVIVSVGASVVGWLVFFAALAWGHGFWTAVLFGISISMVGTLIGAALTYAKAEAVRPAASLNPQKGTSASLEILLVAAERFGALHTQELCNGLGHRIHVLDDLSTALNVVANGAFEWDVLAVDLDSAGALEDTVEKLISFRDEYPGICVVALTGCTQRDDLTSIRRPICDATVKLPATAARLNSALSAALDNHRRR